ncbi:MAG: hypothetical protein EOP21_01410 [Hyphomicrobiales bacterium]|nr:MAG: hypothetical protein EOP21_01410 [Hyphomicrobiales bacterium]
MQTTSNDYPFADTRAAQMLASYLQRSQREGRSIRQLAKQLGYKQAAALSHMAMGRIPIPIERAGDLANTLMMPEADFLDKVLRQRYPKIEWDNFKPSKRDPDEFVFKLEAASGRRVADLSGEQVRIIQEVAASENAARRWVSPAEAGIIEMLRKAKPAITVEGLSKVEAQAMEAFLEDDD